MLKMEEQVEELMGTKAETLAKMSELGYHVPRVFYFTVAEWREERDRVLKELLKEFPENQLAVRSSTKAEDTEESSMAGAFVSLLNIAPEIDAVQKAVEAVVKSFDDDPTNQVLVQPMVEDVAFSGVAMTQVLDDGSPYHVINYDDSTGLTDTVTSGTAINKTVYLYNGVDESDFDSPFLLEVLHLIRSLQKTFPKTPLDIEFAVDKQLQTHLLQVRRITTIKSWKKKVNAKVSARILFLRQYVDKMMQRRPHVYGQRTLLGFMPDWNPAEMIGVVPHPLSMSLYRELITKKAWRIARERMGYRMMPNVELMVSLFGRAYIDVRNSINSFLPEGMDEAIGEKLVNAYVDRLDHHPHLHDKIEFEVVHTAYDFDFEKHFVERYPELLNEQEYSQYRDLLRDLTINALRLDEGGTLSQANKDIAQLKDIQESDGFAAVDNNSFSIADKINTLLAECVEYGTTPFSILARHGFIAEGLLRSAVNNGALSQDRLNEFRRSVVTVAGEMSEDFFEVLDGTKVKEDFLNIYGHLRPNTYDIMSPNYRERNDDLFEGQPQKKHKAVVFVPTADEVKALNSLLKIHQMDHITAEHLFHYADRAIKGREYAKFIFTRHLSAVLELVAEWGAIKGFERKDMSMLTIKDILSILFSPLTNDVKVFYKKRLNKARRNFKVASSFKLSYLIRSVRDVYIVPMQRSAANFIGNKRLEAEVVELTPYLKTIPDLKGKIICIEGADPGYDWIFTRNIAGLVTKYGGANSHMAIRSAEYDIPAAIGCGEQPYQRIVNAKTCLLDCQGKRLEPIAFA